MGNSIYFLWIPLNKHFHCLQWTSPSFLLSQYKDGKANIAPPQLYESFRLIKFNISDLLKFSWHRSQYRVGRWLPVLIGCADGSMMLMPGMHFWSTLYILFSLTIFIWCLNRLWLVSIHLDFKYLIFFS